MRLGAFDRNPIWVYFPFIDKHPPTRKIWRSNARVNQTFGHIAFFRGADEGRLPDPTWLERFRANDPDGFDFRGFEFIELFAQALKNKPFRKLTEAQKEALFKTCEDSISDHMPIWVRLPRPGFRD